MAKLLEVKGLEVLVEGKKVLDGVNLSIGKGEVHALMGRNGSGKSSLALALAGHPKYEVKLKRSGGVKFAGKNLLALPADLRARAGIMLAFQAPIAIPGVGVFTFLRQAYNQMRGEIAVVDLKKRLLVIMEDLGIPEEFLGRYVNDGFSGGERKKMEVLQAILLKPRLLILDEIDSGLDVDSLKLVASAVRKMVRENDTSVLVISHYKRLLEYLEPEYVHVMRDGRVIKSGGSGLVEEIEKGGYGEKKGK